MKNSEPTGASGPNWALLAGIRFVLACMVVAAHSDRIPGAIGSAWDSFGWGWGPFAAVCGFLFISGYSIAHSQTTRPRGFYLRRFNRLAPVYYLSLLLAMGVYAVYYTQTSPDDNTMPWPLMPEHFKTWLAAGLMLGGTFAPTFDLLVPAWSLGYEICYYAVCPLFRRLTERQLVGVFLFSLALYVDNQRFLGFIPMGNILSLLWPWIGGWMLYIWRGNGRREMAVLVCALLFFGCADQHPSRLCNITVGGVILAIIYGGQIQLPVVWARLLSYLGDVSFPLYLSHQPMIWLIVVMVRKRWIPNNLPLEVVIILGVAVGVHGVVAASDSLFLGRRRWCGPLQPQTA